MFNNARSWRVLAAGVAAGLAGVLGVTGATASAEPIQPAPSIPAPVTVTQTVTVAPNAATVAAPAATPAAVGSEVPTLVPAQPAVAPVQPPVEPAAAPAAQPVVAPAAPPAPAQPPLVPATSGTLTDFLKEKGVTLEAQNPRTFRALNITLPMPTGWTQVPDPNVPDAFAVLADRAGGDGLYTSNAQLVVYKLVGGEFDPREAITHGFVDSQQLANWQSTDASLNEFGGFPSSVIEGAYRENDMILNTSRRHVIATAGPDRYLVSLSVTTAANQAVAAADATNAIVNGFRVAVPAAAAPAAPAAAAPVPAAPVAPAPAPAS